MTLAEFTAETRAVLFEAVSSGQPPPRGDYDATAFNEGKAKGKPYMGPVRYEPATAVFEFIYPDPNGAPIILAVRVAAPERIVFMPVPEWVVQQVWEGEVFGTHHFESDARRMMETFANLLGPDVNADLYDAVERIGRS